jgi:hypothetical protein
MGRNAFYTMKIKRWIGPTRMCLRRLANVYWRLAKEMKPNLILPTPMKHCPKMSGSMTKNPSALNGSYYYQGKAHPLDHGKTRKKQIEEKHGTPPLRDHEKHEPHCTYTLKSTNPIILKSTTPKEKTANQKHDITCW